MADLINNTKKLKPLDQDRVFHMVFVNYIRLLSLPLDPFWILTYNLAKFFVLKLSSITTNKFTV